MEVTLFIIPSHKSDNFFSVGNNLSISGIVYTPDTMFDVFFTSFPITPFSLAFIAISLPSFFSHLNEMAMYQNAKKPPALTKEQTAIHIHLYSIILFYSPIF